MRGCVNSECVKEELGGGYWCMAGWSGLGCVMKVFGGNLVWFGLVLFIANKVQVTDAILDHSMTFINYIVGWVDK